MSKQTPKPVDVSDKQACQLLPNAHFLSRSDFIDKAGNLVDRKADISGITKEELQLPGSSKTELKVVLAFRDRTKRLVLNKINIVNILAG